MSLSTGASSSGRQHAVHSPVEAAGGSLLLPRLVGSGIAGISELSIFHPVDTVAKRLMTSSEQLKLSNFDKVVFRVQSNQTLSFFSRLRTLYPGVGFAAGYKICQRSYKFGLQPMVYEALDRSSVGSQIQSKPLKSAIAGSVLGAGEVALLPLDVLKIKAQTNPQALGGRSLMQIILAEGSSLYRGAGWTAARNIPGSFALFGGNSAVKQALGVEGKATVAQTFLSSMGGAVASLAISQPLDVIKTRIQSQPFDSTECGVRIIRSILHNEGAGAFFKGFTPKVVAVGPKLVFSFTIAQQLIQYFEGLMMA